MDIINVISRIENLDKLIAISKSAKAIEKEDVKTKKTPKRVEKTLPLSEAKTGIRTGVTFEQIVEEQNYKKGLQQNDFKELQEDEEWEYTIDELLAALD
jgi:hypothetical protein